MNKLNIIEQIAECIKEAAECTKHLDEKILLKEELGLDSLSLVSVIVGLEEKLNIQFEDSDLDPSKIITIGDIANLVGKYT